MNFATAKGRETGLTRAADAGNAAVVAVLLQLGADTEHMTRFGCTALMKAAGKGSLPVVRALLEHGAPVLTLDKNGKTALDWARAARHAEVAAALEGSLAAAAEALRLRALGEERTAELRARLALHAR